MSGKYAMVWTSDQGYMPGTNANFNAMDFYGFGKVDVFLLVVFKIIDLHEQYRIQLNETYPHITLLDLPNATREIKHEAYWQCVFSDFHFALKELMNYDVVLFWEGDSCIVNNFYDYFEICEKTERIILGSNEQGNQTYAAMSREWPYGHTWDVPYANIPLFVPRSRMDVIQMTLDFQFNDNTGNVDRMDGLNYAIRDLDSKVLVVPGSHWVMNIPSWGTVVKGDRNLYLFNQAMNSFHRKYWSVNYLKNYISGFMQNGGISIKNVKLFNNKYNFFNRNWKLKWEDHLEIWDGKF